MDGHHLCGRRIRLEDASAKQKYETKPRIDIDAPAPEFMLTIVLATQDQPYSRPHDPHIETSFGYLYFRAERQ